MSISNSQYNELMRVYEERQRNNRNELNLREEEIASLIPGFEDIDKEIARVSVANARMRLETGDSDRARYELKAKLGSLSAKKAKLLSAYGFPPDYLEMKYTCPKCKDTGYVGSAKCSCLRQMEINIIYEQSHIKNLLEVNNFSKLSFDYYAKDDLVKFKNAVQQCQTFIENFDKDYRNLYFYGTVGTGKSFLSCCVAKELMDKGKLVLYFSATQLFDTLSRATFDKESPEWINAVTKDIYECDLLIIDDLGTELTNSFVTSQLFACLNNRHLAKKPTIITTNLSLEELRNHYSDRIFSRITSHFNVLKLTGDDIRLKQKIANNRK